MLTCPTFLLILTITFPGPTSPAPVMKEIKEMSCVDNPSEARQVFMRRQRKEEWAKESQGKVTGELYFSKPDGRHVPVEQYP
jgi:hypothetical protein